MLVFTALALSLGVVAGRPSPPAQSVTRLVVGDRLARLDALQHGVRRYVRYLVKPDGGRQLIDLWQRQIETATLPGGRGPALHMTQRWDEARDGAVLIQDSWFDASTLAPITHVRRFTRDGKTTVKGYRFGEEAVTALPGLADAVNADFRVETSERSFNFKYDMELFETLPLAAGAVFDIPFYDAGIDKTPARYRFSVEGSAVIAGWDGQPVECWVLTGDYRTGKVMNRFWISKRGHVLVREEGVGSDGIRMVKTLLPPEGDDGDLGPTAARRA